MLYKKHNEIIISCRRIRKHAKKSNKLKQSLFTFFNENHALCELSRFNIAVKQLHLFFKILYSRNIDLNKFKWSKKWAFNMIYQYGPLFYMNKQYDLGYEIMTKGLNYFKSDNSYELLNNVYSLKNKPRFTYEVTYIHFLNKLNIKLDTWNQYEIFIKNFNPKILKIGKTNKTELLNNSRAFKEFYRNIIKAQSNLNLFSGITRGEADLIQKRKQVKKSQQKFQKNRERYGKRNKDRINELYEKIYYYFPIIFKLKNQTKSLQ